MPGAQSAAQHPPRHGRAFGRRPAAAGLGIFLRTREKGRRGGQLCSYNQDTAYSCRESYLKDVGRTSRIMFFGGSATCNQNHALSQGLRRSDADVPMQNPHLRWGFGRLGSRQIPKISNSSTFRATQNKLCGAKCRSPGLVLGPSPIRS